MRQHVEDRVELFDTALGTARGVHDDRVPPDTGNPTRQPTERVAKLLKISGAVEQFEAAKASK